MRRNGLRNEFIDSKADRAPYSKKSNYNVSLIPQEKRLNFSNINTRDIKNNKNFSKNVKPLCLEKVNLQTNTRPMEKCKTLTEAKISSKADKMISDNRRVAKTFHDFFGEIDPILKSFLK